MDWDHPFEHVQIYMYNLSTSMETPVEYGGWLVMESGLRIYGDRIVYEGEGASTNYNIYMYDLSTYTLHFDPQAKIKHNLFF